MRKKEHLIANFAVGKFKYYIKMRGNREEVAKQVAKETVNYARGFGISFEETKRIFEEYLSILKMIMKYLKEGEEK